MPWNLSKGKTWLSTLAGEEDSRRSSSDGVVWVANCCTQRAEGVEEREKERVMVERERRMVRGEDGDARMKKNKVEIRIRV